MFARVVLYTAKVRFFKQITTVVNTVEHLWMLFCIPQRYDFSSKSQQNEISCGILDSCFVYRKGTIFQANHNRFGFSACIKWLFCIPQRYDFSSKSQLDLTFLAHSLVVLYTAKVRFFKQITTHVTIENIFLMP